MKSHLTLWSILHSPRCLFSRSSAKTLNNSNHFLFSSFSLSSSTLNIRMPFGQASMRRIDRFSTLTLRFRVLEMSFAVSYPSCRAMSTHLRFTVPSFLACHGLKNRASSLILDKKLHFSLTKLVGFHFLVFFASFILTIVCYHKESSVKRETILAVFQQSITPPVL